MKLISRLLMKTSDCKANVRNHRSAECCFVALLPPRLVSGYVVAVT